MAYDGRVKPRAPFLRPAFWLWLCLSAWPPELIAHAMGWDLMAPGYVALLLLWWPLDSLGRLGALRVLLASGGCAGPAGGVALRAALPIALSAEISAGLRSSALALLGLVPAAALLSLVGLESRAWRWALGGLALLGLLPAFVFLLKRALAPLGVLLGSAQSGREALDGSMRQMDGRIVVFLRAGLPWMAAAWLLDGLSLGLPGSAALALSPLSLALGLLGLLRGWRRLA